VHLTSAETDIVIAAAPALATLAGVGVGAWLTGRQQGKSERKTADDRLRRDVAELLAACTSLMLSMQASRQRQETPDAKYHRVLKVIFDFVAHLDPAAWKDWKTARDNGLPAMAGAGSELIVFDRAATQEALTAFTPTAASFYRAVAGLRLQVTTNSRASLASTIQGWGEVSY
jgi:hypothetical protein